MKEAFVRNIVFGVEDGLVSTVGLISGIAVAGVPRATILLTGAVLIFVEAFSMGVGSLLSEHEGLEYEARKEIPIGRSWRDGVIMFLSYFAAGIVPLAPYAIWGVNIAIWVSVVASLVLLFLLGIAAGRAAHIPVFKQGTQMFVLGGAAILLGVIVGKILG